MQSLEILSIRSRLTVLKMTDEQISFERRNYYDGETLNQMRHGYGVYVYENKFFRYEGDWVKGKKHGHGKLLMADGSYYEGEFKDGEIDGHGFRKWQHSGNCYSGEFCKGEMHGHGVMNYVDGTQYQGEFYKNQRHGTGILKGPGNEIYEGSWYKNKKHGQGVQTYDNGDEYEGDWVLGKRQGHGVLNFFDGSVYEGQFWADMFNGEGTMTHISGVVYEGLWRNNEPEAQASQIVIDLPDKQTHIEVVQGKRFSLQLKLTTRDGSLATDEQGREFKISAGYKFVQLPKTSPSQSILELIEDLEAKPVTTPFGYDVLPYPVVECVKDMEDTEETIMRRKFRHTPGDVIYESKQGSQTSLKPDDVQPDAVDENELSSSYSGSKHDISDLDVDAEEDLGQITGRLPPPGTQRSASDGRFEYTDLLLPSAPPNYRPFLQEDEVLSTHSSTPTGSTSSLRRAARGSSVSEKKRSRGSRTTSAASSSSTSITETSKGGKGAKTKGDSDEKGSKPGKVNVRKKGRDVKSRAKGKLSPSKSFVSSEITDLSYQKDAEDSFDSLCEVMNMLYAKEGDYVLIMEEVTNPPFLGKHLPPAFVVVKVTAPIRKTGKKATGKKN